MILFDTIPIYAQGGWSFLDVGYPIANPLNHRRELLDGVVGIGPFAPNPGFEPVRLLHVHSTMPGNVAETPFFEAYLRLQTQNQNVQGDSKYLFGNTGIEFLSGSTINNGLAWHVGKIASVTRGLGVASSGAGIFKTNMGADIDFQGGLAFYCSPTKLTSMPNDGDLHEVMRIINGSVGIGTTDPKDMLHLYEKLTFHVGANEYYIGYNQYQNSSNQIQRIMPTLSSTMGIMFKEDHNIMYITNNGKAIGTAAVNYTEPSGAVKGISIGNDNVDVATNGDKAYIGLGAAWDPNSRVFIRGLSETGTTNAFRVANSGEQYGTPFTRFVVKDNGNVGIGVEGSALKSQLQINQMLGFYADNSVSVFTHNAYYDGAWKRTSGSTGQNKKPALIGMTNGSIIFQVAADGMTGSSITWNTAMGIANDGKVTINNLAGTGERAVYANANGELMMASGSAGGWALGGNDIGDNSYFIGTKNNKPLVFKTNNSTEPCMQIAANGDVHVGNVWDYTSTAGNLNRTNYPSLLSVNGAVVAKLVRVTANNWADNVFRSGYQLMPLTEVAEFIDKNGHLPGVPSEAQVQKEGVDIQEMQATLLRKVEELTLHLIQFERENKQLHKRVEELESK
jgi:hypothetical protein